MFGSQFDPACFNSYLYVPDNPAAFADPLGSGRRAKLQRLYRVCSGWLLPGHERPGQGLALGGRQSCPRSVRGASSSRMVRCQVRGDRPPVLLRWWMYCRAVDSRDVGPDHSHSGCRSQTPNAAIKVSRAAQAASCPSVGGATTPRPPGWNSNWELRDSSRTISNKSRWDPQGGEWHYHPAGADQWHPDPHWDYNPWEQWNNPWQNVPLGD